MLKAEVVRCWFSKSRRKSRCAKCYVRFQCLSRKWTEEDKKAYERVPEVYFRVPNTEEGNAFFKQFRKYINKDRWSIRRYGRATNRKEKGGCQSSVPISNCDWFGVYFLDSEKINHYSLNSLRSRELINNLESLIIFEFRKVI